jgi:MinD superfamily P-loop ATPase
MHGHYNYEKHPKREGKVDGGCTPGIPDDLRGVGREDHGNERRKSMKELVVISGKGGTGKTSVTASLAVLADQPVIAEADNSPLIIVDGPPGIGCPVIASVTGANKVLVVTEPTVSGEHDLERVLSLTRHFDIPTAVCVNKWDLNADMTKRIEEKAHRAGASLAGRIRYDKGITRAQIQEKAVVETGSASTDDIKEVWSRLNI